MKTRSLVQLAKESTACSEQQPEPKHVQMDICRSNLNAFSSQFTADRTLFLRQASGKTPYQKYLTMKQAGIAAKNNRALLVTFMLTSCCMGPSPTMRAHKCGGTVKCHLTPAGIRAKTTDHNRTAHNTSWLLI